MRRPFLVLAAAIAAMAGTVPMQAEAAPPPASDGHGRTVAYWTPARRAAAIPRDLDRKPAAKPGRGGGSTSSTGAVWTKGGDVTKTTGKVFFTLGGIDYVCSGSAVQSPHGNLVLTAGHCVHDGDGGAFATRWIFYPGWNGSPSPTLGSWTATRLFTTRTWSATADGFDDDAGFAVVSSGGSATLQGVLTGQGARVPTIAFDGPSTVQTYSAFGYPAAKKYKGNTLTYCAGQVQIAYDGHQTMALPCDMTGGSSGGPWLVDYDTGARVIESLNSYGYQSLHAIMFGPIFDSAEQAAFAAASTGTCTADPDYACTGP